MKTITDRINSILLVDDNASLNMVNVRYIERLEIAQQVAEVRNGQELGKTNYKGKVVDSKR